MRRAFAWDSEREFTEEAALEAAVAGEPRNTDERMDIYYQV
jgi:hypothetical protein